MDGHIIIAGQSNALGHLNTGPAPYAATARVQIWTDTNGDGQGDAWNYMRPGVNTGTAANPTAWGPEVGEAKAWLAQHPTGILWIVKNDQTVHGSTGLASDPGQLDWSPRSAGEMYASATVAIQTAMHNLDGTGFAFDHYDKVDWMQGETDATDPVKAAAYGANVRELIAEARQDWSVDQFVVGRITDTAGAWSDEVRGAQWTLDNGDAPLADVHSFKTIGFGMRPDGLHYDAAGQLALGQGFYDGWATP